MSGDNRAYSKEELERAFKEFDKMRFAIDESRSKEIERAIRPTGKGDRRKRRELKPKGKKRYGW
jgi:hypothetical protein